MAEVQIGREPTRYVRIRIVPLVTIPRQSRCDELRQALTGRDTAPSCRGRPHLRARTEVGCRRLASPIQREPALVDRSKVHFPDRERRHFRRRRLQEKRSEVALEEAPEVVGRAERLVRNPDGQESAPVDSLAANIESLGRRANHPGKEEGRVVVGHDRASARRERFQESFSIARTSLDVGHVRHAGRFEGPSVVDHAVDDELMKAFARPRVFGAKCLQHDERLVPRSRQRHRLIEREVARRVRRCADHPVEDVVGVGADGCPVQDTDTICGGRVGHPDGSVVRHLRARPGPSPRTAGWPARPRRARSRVCADWAARAFGESP